MTGTVAIRQSATLPAMQMSEPELMRVLSTSVYPGAAAESIKLVLGYCKAAGLDPMQKPVHIVPMWDKNSGSMRDVVMPGIGLYRTQAARSGQFAGVSEPEFGPEQNEKIGGQDTTYPEWCRVTVRRRLESGIIAEFTAVERWKENYAVKGGKEKSIAPNAMWARRAYGQLAKCTEAQALRKAFPEFGSQPTADEMEGKHIEGEVVDVTPPKPIEKPAYDAAKFTENLPKWAALVASGKKTAADILRTIESKATLTDEQHAQVARLESTATAPKPDVATQPDKEWIAAAFPEEDDHADA